MSDFFPDLAADYMDRTIINEIQSGNFFQKSVCLNEIVIDHGLDWKTAKDMAEKSCGVFKIAQHSQAVDVRLFFKMPKKKSCLKITSNVYFVTPFSVDPVKFETIFKNQFFKFSNFIFNLLYFQIYCKDTLMLEMKSISLKMAEKFWESEFSAFENCSCVHDYT